MTIRQEFVYTYGLDGTQTGVVAEFVDLEHEQRSDGLEELRFVIPATLPAADLLVEDGEVRWGPRRFKVASIVTNREGSKALTTVRAEGLWIEMVDYTINGLVSLDDASPGDGVQALIDAAVSSFTWRVDDTALTVTPVRSYEFVDTNLLAAVQTWCALVGVFPKFDTANRVITLHDSAGYDQGVSFRFGRNVKSVEREVRPPTFTRLYPFGADGLNVASEVGVDYVEDFTYYTDLGLSLAQARARHLKSRRFEDSGITDAADLLAVANTLLAEGAAGRISYKMTVADLSELIGYTENYQVGDTARVADSPLGVDVRVIVTRRVQKPLRPSESVVELAYNSATESRIPSGASTGGGAKSWLLFGKNNGGTYLIRNDATATLACIGLRFRAGGEAVFGAEIRFTGVGAGTLSLEAVDYDTDELVSEPMVIPYTDGVVVHRVNLSAWLKDLEGEKDYRIRAQTTATGGPSATKGFNLAPDDCKFWILAYGAVRQTVTLPNSETFLQTGAIQEWTVPDGIYEAEMDVKGGPGGGGSGGKGGQVTARFVVVPGTVYNVHVNYNNGGSGGQANGTGAGGGSASYVIEQSIDPGGGVVTGAIIVAAGGGGQGDQDIFAPGGSGGFGGFYAGGDGTGSGHGYGATQSAPGAGGGGEAGDTDGQGHGGDGPNSGAAAVAEGGGGGGGWHGGGAAGNGTSGGAGGGGSGYVHPDVYDLEINDGSNSGPGVIVISWGIPAVS